MTDDRLERLYALKAAAEAIASPLSNVGRRARVELADATLLSAEGIEYALSECLETEAGRSTLSELVRRAPTAANVHVLLSANVFTGAYRAIAVALAQSTRVFVRPSRREPVMCRLLEESCRGAFSLVTALAPEPGDHYWAYGADQTLAELRGSLPAGVHFHGHGAGLGVAVIRQPESTTDAELTRAADALAQDVLAFDQRGCLSPRVVLAQGSRAFAADFTDRLARALAAWELAIPRGQLDGDERADAERYEATMTYLGAALPAGSGLVALDPETDRLVIPPVGRYLHVTQTDSALRLLKKLAPRLTSVGFFNGEELPGLCRREIGPRRYVELGTMQRPPLDGPIDLRADWSSELL